MTTVLDDIIAGVREDLETRKTHTPLADLQAYAAEARQPIDVVPIFKADPLSVIAEVKRSSPSEGALASIDSADELALTYVGGGASAISVLTEQRRFGGTLTDLDIVRMRVDQPILRKDFIVDPYQIYENRVHGADITLLIVAALNDAQLAAFHALSLELGLRPLVEVHTVEEAKRALDVGAELIGVNNRNLKTLEVDLSMFERIVHVLPDSVVKVAESGIHSPFDALRMRRAGADAILVGSSLVKDANPAAAIRAMIGAAQ